MAWSDSFKNLRANMATFFAKDREAVRMARSGESPHDIAPDGGMIRGQGGMWYDAVRIEHDLVQRYRDYEDMDDYADLHSALDIYADEATPESPLHDAKIWIEGDDDVIVKEMNLLMSKQLNMDANAQPMIRSLCKYGQEFDRLFVTPEDGLIGFEPLPPAMTRRVRDEHGFFMGYATSRNTLQSMEARTFEQLLQARRNLTQFGLNARHHYYQRMPLVYDDWEVVHFRLSSNDRMDEYGASILEPVRTLYRKLTLLEDALIVHKLTRAPGRYVFYVDTGHYTGVHALEQVRRVRDEFKKTKFIDPDTGKLNMAYSPLQVDEDIFIPSHAERGPGVKVETLQGPDYQGTQEQQYFRGKMGTVLGIPQFGQAEGPRSKPLSHEDIRFASKIRRIQDAFRAGVDFMMQVHLIATGRHPDDYHFYPMMASPSAIMELARVEVMAAKADLLSRLGEHISIRWLLSNLYGLTDDEVVTLMAAREEEIDYKRAAEIKRNYRQEQASAMLQKKIMGEDVDIETRRARMILAESIPNMKADRGAYGVTIPEIHVGGAPSDINKLRKLVMSDPQVNERLRRLEELIAITQHSQQQIIGNQRIISDQLSGVRSFRR